MATVRVKVRPSGLINGQDWPQVGETMELPDQVAEDMSAAGWLEVVKDEKKVEKRPASRKGVETRRAAIKDGTKTVNEVRADEGLPPAKKD